MSKNTIDDVLKNTLHGSGLSSANAAIIEQFLTQNKAIARYLVGQNPETAILAKHIPIQGIIDDHATSSEWNGLPILPMSSVPKHAWVVNCATSISPVRVQHKLQDAGFEHVLGLSDLLRHAKCPHDLLPHFVLDQQLETKAHLPDWNALFNRLEDDVSKQTLLDVLRFRLTADARYMEFYSVRMHDQYFESFLNLGHEVFVDAGGYDGDTTLEFCKRIPEYQKVYVFEPDPNNMFKAKERLQHHRDIVFISIGLSDAKGVLSFNSAKGSASSISQHGSLSIEVNTLDALVLEPVTFIKMDLEGWELKALAGCRHHIKTHKPKLAISVYHQAAHFREVMDWVLSVHPDYKVYLRHYSQGWSETVMFFC